MNYNPLFYFFLFLFSNAYSQSYFEGDLYYEISYHIDNDKLSKRDLIRGIGDSLSVYLKEDKFITVHNSKGKLGKRKTIFLLKEGFGYIDYEKSDTILKFDLSKKSGNLMKFIRNEDKKRVVMGNVCKSITIEYSFKNSKYFKKHFGNYFFSTSKYQLNPIYYKGFRNNFWNLYAEESGAISLRNEIEYFPFYKYTQQVYASIKRKLPDSMFIIDKNKYIKQIEIKDSIPSQF